MAAAPNIQTSSNPAVLAGGAFGAVIPSTNTSASTPAAIVDGNLTVNGTVSGTFSGAAAAGTLSGTTLAANVVTSSLTALGVQGVLRVATQTPASAAAAGAAGTIAWDADYIYVCVATNTWKRVAIATWP